VRVVITEEGERKTLVEIACRLCGHRLRYHVRWDLNDDPERAARLRVEMRCPHCGALVSLWHPAAAYDRQRQVM
jgi:DNA-directed RNA polymerase subunit RPC12/RpoP